MTAEMTPYKRFDSDNRYAWQLSRKENAFELYQICEGVLGYSNVIDLREPITIIVHPLVCDIPRYKPFIQKNKGPIIILEEDHELDRTLNYFDSFNRFKKSRFTRLTNSFRPNNFLYVPTANNDPMPMWGVTDQESYLSAFRARMDVLEKTSWLRFAEFINSLKSGGNPNFQIINHELSRNAEPVRLAGGYWPSGCAGVTKARLEHYGIRVEPIEKLMYFTK